MIFSPCKERQTSTQHTLNNSLLQLLYFLHCERLKFAAATWKSSVIQLSHDLQHGPTAAAAIRTRRQNIANIADQLTRLAFGETPQYSQNEEVLRVSKNMFEKHRYASFVVVSQCASLAQSGQKLHSRKDRNSYLKVFTVRVCIYIKLRDLQEKNGRY